MVGPFPGVPYYSFGGASTPDHTGRYSCAAISADATRACGWQAEICADCRLSAKSYGGERPHSLTLAQSDIALRQHLPAR